MTTTTWDDNNTGTYGCPYCKIDTMGNHESHCPRNPINRTNRYTRGAWECPRCHQINAPWKSSCDCGPKTITVTTTDDILNLEVKTFKLPNGSIVSFVVDNNK